jgi:putative hydrolase of the HAD superfamily
LPRTTALSDVIKALIFDLDDTRIVEEPVAVDAFMEVCRQAEQQCEIEASKLCSTVRETARSLWHQSPARQYCIEIGISSWEGLWAQFDGDDPNLRMLRKWAPYYRLKSWETALIKCGVSDVNLTTHLADAFRKNRRKHIILYDDALNCLDKLSKLFPLALCTNGAPDLQREKINTTGIWKYFKEIIVSGEAGYGKPDRHIYELVLYRLGVKRESVYNIGDSLERDIRGAKAAGIKTIWINRHGLSRDESIIPDIEVANLGQLVSTIIQLDRK